MNRIMSWPRITVALVLFAGGLLLAQGRYRERAKASPWHIVISKPIVGLGWTAGTLYREHEYLSAMFNQLELDGLVPLNLQVMTQRVGGLVGEDRLLVVCREK
jgi:hypothetical protein